MSRKKDDNVLDLGPLAADLGSTNMCPMPVSSRWVLTRDEELMIEEDRKQQLAIELGAVKGRFGASKIVEVHQHATLIFDETTGVIMDIKDRPGRTQQHQAYIDQFSEREIQVLAQHLLGVINVTATDIATEIHKSPYPSPEPEPPAKYGRRKGFLRRLLGYGE